MKFLLASVFTAVLSICSITRVAAQTDNPKYEWGVNLGFTIYQGDLTPHRLGSIETQKFALGIHAGRLLSSSFSVRGHLLVSRLTGDESIYDEPAYRKMRNFRFTTPLTELSLQFAWNMLGRNYAEKGFSPYVFAGGGVAFVRINRDYSNYDKEFFDAETSVGLSADSAHALPRILPVVPVGAGVKYFFSERFGVNAEASYRLTFTDYVDGFSQSVSPEHNDHYLNYSIGVIFRSGNKSRLGCPTFTY